MGKAGERRQSHGQPRPVERHHQRFGVVSFMATIPTGTWEVRAISPDGSLTETKMDMVTKDGTTTVNFTLK